MLVIVFALLLSIVVGIILIRSDNSIAEGFGVLICALTTLMVLVALVTLPIERFECRTKIVEFISVKETVARARVGDAYIESAALQHKIVEANKWLARVQFYNDTIFDIYFTDEVDALTPIE
ncbi:hypothetical protein LCGC14_1455410, partial [marine sediment metagenome]